jgi:hypothetical protein
MMDRSRQDYALSVVPTGHPRFGGLDTGDRFWFVARESEGAANKRFAWAEQISPTTARVRVPQLFDACGLSCLFVDIGNERAIARDIVMAINRIASAPPIPQGREPEHIDFGNGLRWNGQRKLWTGLRAACVEFSGKPGGGVIHELRLTPEGLAFPVIRANRDETIQRAVDEFMTYDDGLLSVVDGRLRTEPVMRMPANAPGANAAVAMLQEHFISGSRKAPGKDGKTLSFVDKVTNHYLLANAYSALAEAASEGAARARGTGAASGVNQFNHDDDDDADDDAPGARSRRAFNG